VFQAIVTTAAIKATANLRQPVFYTANNALRKTLCRKKQELDKKQVCIFFIQWKLV